MRAELSEYEEQAWDDVPASARLQRVQPPKYGQVVDLDDTELADPAELERVLMWQFWEPILALRPTRSGAHAELGSCLHPDWSAIGMIDCERVTPRVERACQRADRRADLGRVLQRIETLNEQLPGNAKYLVLKFVRMGVIGTDHIVDTRMRTLVRLYFKARWLRAEIARLYEDQRSALD